ncbi:MAG: 7-cyano-7-deazaguanine synthase QueC [Deltaproteobacteria bacterium RIFCSPLOWO2_01_44_7]|nr:MAG: 7-cyano-7-deazaguanine synthase QueC [Deltaproteobacteria bacterium RIFCSPHIGHO2_01_FULL_43_49]OGQ14700.1 MAG: 7-cyano-7-deazaguanine synthase QueC [Deltaproteobacteria bacterium RIFCSPHIGHO2_02_FULL_44_53]OGQ28086.1 MAG: 7-cyano-7-deazaguanine synthase QueC [Deltaproteobacteria bacterium RIFCSPHIGHO2_12_FULL_44_21]OGQ31298.1 MAG: 7-cyano-7-deazaguanine synthase QueC [Deltaproteobacteria bacterium RIFCSPLOWO2_01_FULL_45_74]OGQ38861.1 MAG: 7-cyano-7-deazaguanine synthase QueC [Deltaprote
MDRAVTLLSGGLDSYLSTAVAKQYHEVVLALTFNYGQRAANQETKAAQKIAKLWRIKHQVVELPWLKSLGENALTHTTTLLPRFSDLEKLKDKKATEKSAEAVWVPNRNGVFLNIAASFAESLGATTIITGFNREEAATFPDNSSDYVHRLNRALELSTLLYPPKVKSYVQEINKKEMVAKLIELDLPLDNFWSCYEGKEKMCGVCESCARTLAAFKANDLSEKISHRF